MSTSKSAPVAAAAEQACAIGVPRAVTAGVGRAGHRLDVFEDSDDFLLSDAPFDYGAYLVRLEQRGVPGLNLIRLLRKRSSAPVIAVVDALDEGFAASLDAGATLVVPLAAPPSAFAAALRRALQSHPAPATSDWVLDTAGRTLSAPDGSQISLGATDAQLLALFAGVGDHSVGHDALKAQLWGDDGARDLNALHAAMYRLRKRIEQGSRSMAPLQAVPKVGYVFKGRLTLAVPAKA